MTGPVESLHRIKAADWELINPNSIPLPPPPPSMYFSVGQNTKPDRTSS